MMSFFFVVVLVINAKILALNCCRSNILLCLNELTLNKVFLLMSHTLFKYSVLKNKVNWSFCCKRFLYAFYLIRLFLNNTSVLCYKSVPFYDLQPYKFA